MISTKMPDTSYSGPLEPLSQDEVVLRDRLQTHVWTLADEIGERNIWHEEKLDASAHYIRKVFTDVGYDVEIQGYAVQGIPVRNFEATLTGSSLPEEIIVVGAHYDDFFGQG
jgi:acetylornithine deacetylase/succinyl-diaminopimelate desuccinylase-like protein